MSALVDCPACQFGDHANHVEQWDKAPEGVLGGASCGCRGDCKPPDLSKILPPMSEHETGAGSEQAGGLSEGERMALAVAIAEGYYDHTAADRVCQAVDYLLADRADHHRGRGQVVTAYCTATPGCIMQAVHTGDCMVPDRGEQLSDAEVDRIADAVVAKLDDRMRARNLEALKDEAGR